MPNKNLHAAKVAKNDEFYTQLTDIEKELKHYKEHFKDKIVYCNCDNPKKSAFCEFFRMKFIDYGLKKLICTCITEDNSTGWIYTWDKDINGNGILDEEEVTMIRLQGNGDFRSEECIELLKQADIVVTNPPFSLFREYVAQLMKYNKKFLVIGNMNAVTFKEIFPLIKENKMWLGQNAKGGTRKGNSLSFITKNGESKDVSSWWYTNLDCPRHNRFMDLYKKYKGHEKEFPKYDNYDAIECGKSCDIPMDYDGVIGVPISFLMFHCPEQFEIVSFRKGEDGKDLVFTREREREFNLTFVSLFDLDTRDDKKCRRQSEWENYLRENNDKKNKITEPIDYFFPKTTNLANGMINNQTINGKKGYCRILIRFKK